VSKPSLKINAVSNWCALGVNTIVGIVLTPFIIFHLGKQGYGVWTLVGSFIGYYSLLDFGVGTAITRYTARYAAQKDNKALNRIAGTAMAMFVVTGILAVVASLALAAPLARFFEVSDVYFASFKYVVWILGLSVAFNFPANVIESTVVGYERFLPVNIVRATGTLLRAGLIAVFLLTNKGLVGVAYATLIVAVFRLLAARLLCWHYTPQVRFSIIQARLSVWTELLAYGGVTTVIIISSLIQVNIGNLVVGKYLGLTAVATYGIAGLLIRYLRQFIIQGTGVLQPRFASLDGAGQQQKMRSLFLKATSNAALLSFGLGALAIIFGGKFIVYWVGENFAEAVPVLWILTAAHSFCLAQSPGVGLLYALKKHHYYAVAISIESAAIIVLNILLVPIYGITGAAWGTAIPLFVCRLFQILYVTYAAKVSIARYIKCLGIPLIITAGTVAAAWCTGMVENYRRFSVPASLLQAVVVVLVLGVLSLLVSESFTRTIFTGFINRFKRPKQGISNL